MTDPVRVRCPACGQTAWWDEWNQPIPACARCGGTLLRTGEPCQEPADEPVVVEEKKP